MYLVTPELFFEGDSVSSEAPVTLPSTSPLFLSATTLSFRSSPKVMQENDTSCVHYAEEPLVCRSETKRLMSDLPSMPTMVVPCL